MRFVISFFCAVLVSVAFVSSGYCQTDADYFARDEIPAAGPETVQAYYDPFTGDVLVSIGENIGAIAFGVPSTVNNPVDVANLQASFEAIDQDAVLEDAIDAGTFQNDSNGVAWGGIPLPTGVFDIGPIYEALPTPGPLVLNSPLLTIDTSSPESFLTELFQRSIEEQIEIELALQGLYRFQPTGFSLASVAFGAQAQVVPIRFLRPELGITIPEPCSAILIQAAGAGLLLRRRRA